MYHNAVINSELFTCNRTRVRSKPVCTRRDEYYFRSKSYDAEYRDRTTSRGANEAETSTKIPLHL